MTFVTGCTKRPEMTLEEIENARKEFSHYYADKTITKPYEGQDFADGKTGGTYNTIIGGEPKSFNFLIAERDGETTGILSVLTDYLVDYDTVKKAWVPRLADFEIAVDEKRNRMDVIYTLRDNLYWSFYENAQPKVEVTADDVVFWYNEIYCDQEMGSSGYNSQFMELEDGSTGKVTIEKLGRKKFAFHFPRIVANPLLSTNMDFGPAFIYKAAKDKGGAEAVKNLHTIDTDPKLLPSLGTNFIVQYDPGQKIVYKRNPDYWGRDSKGTCYNYPETTVAQIVSDPNLIKLLFEEGKVESYSPTPELVNEVIGNASKYNYSVFNAAGSLGASFWSFNQNPQFKNQTWYKWFTKKEFRQAMSCLLNRDRICWQTYRGLAEPKYDFFPEPNAFYDKSVELKYKYDQKQAAELLKSIGIEKREDGFMHDSEGVKIEFDLSIASSNTNYSKISQIITDECKKAGITVNVRQTDFQTLVEQLTTTYEWQSILIGFGGSNIFPTQGSNVWLSAGNLHLWHPLQKTAATDWESRMDYLYNEAKCLVDEYQARPLWKEYQEIVLEQCPVIYLVRSKSFWALNNMWDFTNVYYDNMNGAMTDRIFLKD